MATLRNRKRRADSGEGAHVSSKGSARVSSADDKVLHAFHPKTAWDVLKPNLVFAVVLGALLFALWTAFPSPRTRSGVWKAVLVYGVTLGFGVFDLVVTRHSPARWLWIHAVGNMVVSVVSFPDMVQAFRDPAMSMNGECNMLAAYIIPAIHVYHIVAFRGLSMGDIVHHVVFAGVICPIGLYMEGGVVQNAVAFYMCGFPGGLDYIMLAVRRDQSASWCGCNPFLRPQLVKHKKMGRNTEKKWNARINVWFRSPGLLAVAFTIWVGREYGMKHTGVHPVPLYICMLLCYLNGQYYMQVQCTLYQWLRTLSVCLRMCVSLLARSWSETPSFEPVKTMKPTPTTRSCCLRKEVHGVPLTNKHLFSVPAAAWRRRLGFCHPCGNAYLGSKHTDRQTNATAPRPCDTCASCLMIDA